MEGRISKTEFILKQHKSRLSGTEYIRKNGKMVEALPLPAKEKVCADLQLYFNKHFDKMFQQKEHEISILKQRNDRLRTILSELKITCKASLNVPPPVDPTWSQEEKTEFVIKTEDSEVPVLPYISPSQQEILDKIKAEEERQQLLLAADNFRELALIEMMDGVLEIRWEDELKKEIPKPTCMLEKEIEDYTENDLRAIKVYEEKCRFLQSERERYRKMLEHEYKKLTSTIEKSLTTFDEQLFELFQIKLKVEAAINQEQLKILRVQKMNADRLHNKEKEQQTKNYVQESEHELNIMQETVNQLQEECNQCHNTYETLVARDKMLGKKFKSEFQGSSVSASVVDQLYKVFRRRPKMQPRVVLYPTLLQELSRCVTEYDQNAFLPPEFHDFLHLLEQLDHYSNAAANIEESAWTVMVHARRSKIESELKVKASALELAEAENTLILYTRKLRALKDKFNNSVSELKNVREEKLKINKDIELQLVMKHGLVEISTTGHLSDFEDVLLINHSVIEDINKNVREAGAKKIAAMMAVTNLHRIIKYKEWEFNKMKMGCEDLQDEINNIENIKVTHEVKQYLMDLANPKEADEQEKSTTLIKQTEENYRKTINNLTEEIVATESKIEHYRILSERTDKEILTLKCDLSKQQFERDITFEEKLNEASYTRMAVIVKRSQLVQEIQQNHKDNIILQTELELLRLKTYPTLKIKTIFN